jgi:type IV pilus assembly protein PilO
VAIDLNEKPWWVALLVGLVLGVALFVVLQMYVFKPIEEDIQSTQDDIDQLEREIEKGRAAKADLPRLEEDIRNYELDLDRLRRILPTKRETDDLIKRLKHLMERGNFRLTRFVPGNIVEREFYLERPITVELDGTYHELGLFFDRMSGFSRIINVNDLVITPVRGKGGGDFSIHAAFTQRTFIYKE